MTSSVGCQTEAPQELIPLFGGLRYISKEANEPVTLYAQDVQVNGLLAHFAKPATMIEQQNEWSNGTIQFCKGEKPDDLQDDEEKSISINLALACAHSLYIRELVDKQGVQSFIVNCSALPFHWHCIKAVIQFIKTGSLLFDSSKIQDMVQSAMFFRIAQLSRLMESFLRQRSTQPETVLSSYKAIFQDEQTMRCVTMETQQIVGDNMLRQLPIYMDEAAKTHPSSLMICSLILQQMTANELSWLFERDAQTIRQDEKEKEGAACQRFQIVVRWLKFHEPDLHLTGSSYRDVHYNFFTNTSRLFSSVHFEYISPEIRRLFVDFLGSSEKQWKKNPSPYQ